MSKDQNLPGWLEVAFHGHNLMQMAGAMRVLCERLPPKAPFQQCVEFLTFAQAHARNEPISMSEMMEQFGSAFSPARPSGRAMSPSWTT